MRISDWSSDVCSSDLIALALERVHFVEAANEAQISVESERLRNALLSAVSHDVRTPLTAIIGLSTTLATQQSMLSDAMRAELIEAIQDEAFRMNKLVTNLLYMGRLQTGGLKQIGRETSRESVCQSVWISVGAVS